MTQPIVTIDAITTRDIDDAFTVQAVEGGYLLTVMIADPTRLVPVGSDQDTTALANVATVYRRDAAVLKMLPAFVSENKGSLVCGQKRDAMVIELKLDEHLAVADVSIKFAPIQVTHRLCHEDIPQILSNKEHELHGLIRLVAGLASRKLEIRRNSGALALYDLQQFMLTDEEGRVHTFKSKDEVMGYIIVQEMMIMANVAVADMLLQNDIPAIFRNHVPKKSAPESKDMAATLQGWMDQGGTGMADNAKRLLAQVGSALYEACVKGHYGLAVPAYVHTTSPLRRYADLVNIRQLKAFLAKEEVPYTSEQLSGLAAHINFTLAERDAAREAHFKNVVKTKAESHMAADKLYGAPEEILVQAIKIVASSGLMPGPLETELNRLFQVNAMTDKVVDAMLVKLPSTAWPASLATAYIDWLRAVPSRTMHALTHAEQAGGFTYKFSTISVAGGFTARCVLRKDGQQWIGESQGGRKREAEQAAAAAALGAKLAVVEAPEPMPAEIGEGAEVAVHNVSVEPSVEQGEINALSPNPKGMLITMCQAMKCSAPEYETHSAGPAHCLTFSCTAGISVGSHRITETASASSKKDAEAKASQALLIKLAATKEAVAGSAPEKPLVLVSAHVASSNFKGTLMELCQKNRWAVPTFNSRSVGPSHQPQFNTIVEIEIKGARRKAEGVGGTKKAAEAHACQMLLAKLHPKIENE